jgi:oxygen-independent coproporphyrinogen-3 oxidase
MTSTPEITLEANPDDLTEDVVFELRAAGITRLSIGIQSFHDELLQYLNRAHSSTSATESFQYARAAGFANISIDLIYAIPGLSLSQWKNEIKKAIDLGPEHVSAYSLTIEEKTVFGHRAAKGSLIAIDDDSSALQLDILVDELQKAGFEHYEVSNFCQPGFHSRHNSSYWKQEKYLGVGPSAHSYDGKSRQYNIKNNALYVKALAKESIPFEKEILTRHDHINEYLMTTLRTSWGSEVAKLKIEYDFDILTERGTYIQELLDRNLAIVDNGFLKLTKRGRMMADKISSDLFVALD